MAGVPNISSECADLIEVVARRLEPRSKEIAEQLVRRLILDVPELSDHDDELLAMAIPNVGLVTAMARSWTDLESVPPPKIAVEWARSLAARRLPMDVIIRVYRSGQAGYQDLWYQELVASDCAPDVLLEALRACSAFLFMWVGSICRPLIEAYEAEVEVRRRGAEEVRSEIVRRILGGEEVDLAVAGARLDYNLRLRHLAFVAWREEAAPGQLEDIVAAVNQALGSKDLTPLVIREPAHAMSGWIQSPQFDEAALLRLHSGMHSSGGHVALGSVEVGLSGFRSTYDHARRASRVARLLRPDAQVTSYTDVAVADLLTRDVSAAQQVTRTILGPLASSDEASRRTRETLRVFFEEGQNFARAARRLGYHPNTVAYRVRRAIELTGQDGPNSYALQAAVSMSALLDQAQEQAEFDRI